MICLVFKAGLEEIDTAISKVRQLALKMKKSTKQYENYNYVLKELKISTRKVPLDARKRWNSTFFVLLVALQDCQAIDVFTSAMWG